MPGSWKLTARDEAGHFKLFIALPLCDYPSHQFQPNYGKFGKFCNIPRFTVNSIFNTTFRNSDHDFRILEITLWKLTIPPRRGITNPE